MDKKTDFIFFCYSLIKKKKRFSFFILLGAETKKICGVED